MFQQKLAVGLILLLSCSLLSAPAQSPFDVVDPAHEATLKSRHLSWHAAGDDSGSGIGLTVWPLLRHALPHIWDSRSGGLGL